MIHFRVLGQNFSEMIIVEDNCRSEWRCGLYSLRQVIDVKLGRVRSNSVLVTLKA